jgi:uncharacterized spore protein YtfJ
MTAPEIPPEVQATGPAAEILERLADKLGGKASVSAVFGDPVERDGITIIPVAKVGFGLGAGAGTGNAKLAQGGGGGVSATPAGYIEIKDGNAVFKPIRDPLADVLIPLGAALLRSAVERTVRRFRRGD